MNLIDYIDRGAGLDPNRDCLVVHNGSRRLTYEQVVDLSHRIAARLIEDGYGPGSNIGIYSPNDPMGFVCVLGVLRAGATWITMNVKSTTQELGDLLNVLHCDVMFFHATLRAEAAGLAEDLGSLKAIVDMEGLSDWMAPSGTRASPTPTDPEGVVILAGTGGTTGRPKGVPLTNRQLHLMSVAFNAHTPEPSPPVFVMATPMTHAAGAAAFPVLGVGGTIVVHDGVIPTEILRSIEEHRATRVFLPPTALYSLLSDESARDRDFSSLRYFLVSAAPVAPDRLIEAVDVLGPVVTQVFGQTEAPFICTFFGPNEIAEAAVDESKRHRLASCGRPSLVALVEVMDPEGRILTSGEVGEIVIKSDLVLSGYFENVSATLETVRPGGWHGTGDVGYRDEDGFVYIVDRQKDMIITGGFNVFPNEVEQVIHSFDAVADCAVIGIPDSKWGEAVTAVVELKAGRHIEAAAVIDECRARLGPVKAPKSVIVRPLPRSSIGKVLKRTLRDEYWIGHDRQV